MSSSHQLALLRVLAVLLFMLGFSSMHSPDLAHSAPIPGPGVSVAMTDMPHQDLPMQGGGGSSPHHGWVGACLAVLGSLCVALSLGFLIRGSQPQQPARWPRPALFGPVTTRRAHR